MLKTFALSALSKAIMLIRIFYLIFVIPQVVLVNMPTDPNNYGPYIAKCKRYEACRGPKSKNISDFHTLLLLDGNKGVFNFTFPTSVRIEEIKIFVFTLKENQKKLLWNYKVDNPCQHFALGHILEKQFHVHKNCAVDKGSHYSVVNFTETTQKFLGPSFFYGDFLFKFVILCRTGNIACFIFNTEFMKKV